MAVTRFESMGVPYYAAEELKSMPGIVHGFSTRIGGVSEGIFDSLNLGISRGDNPDCVRENYRRFSESIQACGNRYVTGRQVHGTNVHVVTCADVKKDVTQKAAFEADGLVTDIPGIILVVFSADCIPVLLYDPDRKVIAALHAGWRGTAGGIVTKAVDRMRQVYGCHPESIRAIVGPGIGPCCFETHEDVPNAMMTAVSSLAIPYIKVGGNGKFSVDLKGINAARLLRSGLIPENIVVSEQCTACQQEEYWSHRRQGKERGSMAAMIEMV